MPTLPSVQEVRDWVKVAATSVDDAQLQKVIGSEADGQAQVCHVPADPPDADPAPALPDPLWQALLRRCARQLAARQVPLGLIGDPASEAGQQRLAFFDAEVERLEGPFRTVVFG